MTIFVLDEADQLFMTTDNPKQNNSSSTNANSNQAIATKIIAYVSSFDISSFLFLLKIKSISNKY
jgi:hypothetical protein